MNDHNLSYISFNLTILYLYYYTVFFRQTIEYELK